MKQFGLAIARMSAWGRHLFSSLQCASFIVWVSWFNFLFGAHASCDEVFVLNLKISTGGWCQSSSPPEETGDKCLVCTLVAKMEVVLFVSHNAYYEQTTTKEPTVSFGQGQLPNTGSETFQWSRHWSCFNFCVSYSCQCSDPNKPVMGCLCHGWSCDVVRKRQYWLIFWRVSPLLQLTWSRPMNTMRSLVCFSSWNFSRWNEELSYVFKSLHLRTEAASGIIRELGVNAGLHVAQEQPDTIFVFRNERIRFTTIEFHPALCTCWIFDITYDKGTVLHVVVWYVVFAWRIVGIWYFSRHVISCNLRIGEGSNWCWRSSMEDQTQAPSAARHLNGWFGLRIWCFFCERRFQ